MVKTRDDGGKKERGEDFWLFLGHVRWIRVLRKLGEKGVLPEDRR